MSTTQVCICTRAIDNSARDIAWAKINNMLVSGNMTPQKMGRKVGKIFYFKKEFCPIFYFMTHLFPTAQLNNRGVEAQAKAIKFLISFFIYMFYWIK